MGISIDSFTRIGKGHTICEDYCIHGSTPFPYVILADGCSSSKDTDVGARILVHSIKNHLNEFINSNRGSNATFEYIGNWAIKQSAIIADILQLPKTCLDATLILMHLLNDTIHIGIYGDGAILHITKNDDIYCDQIKYSANAPEYLSYQLDTNRHKTYLDLNNHRQLKKFNPSSIQNYTTHSHSIRNFSVKDTKAVIITTDGIESFISPMNGVIDTKIIIDELTKFKNTNGAFIQRRCNRMIRDFEKEGYYHTDDFSVGGFYFK